MSFTANRGAGRPSCMPGISTMRILISPATETHMREFLSKACPVLYYCIAKEQVVLSTP